MASGEPQYAMRNARRVSGNGDGGRVSGDRPEGWLLAIGCWPDSSGLGRWAMGGTASRRFLLATGTGRRTGVGRRVSGDR
jgi:hypothetical protein